MIEALLSLIFWILLITGICYWCKCCCFKEDKDGQFPVGGGGFVQPGQQVYGQPVSYGQQQFYGQPAPYGQAQGGFAQPVQAYPGQFSSQPMLPFQPPLISTPAPGVIAAMDAPPAYTPYK